jgi:hypothetical protein
MERLIQVLETHSFQDGKNVGPFGEEMPVEDGEEIHVEDGEELHVEDGEEIKGKDVVVERKILSRNMK